MPHSVINTLEYAKKFEQYGFPQEQAEGLANALFEVMDDHGNDHATKSDLANFATKSDLANFATKSDLANFATKSDIANFATKNDLESLKIEMLAEMQKLNHQTLTRLGSLIGVFAIISSMTQILG